VEQCGAPAGQRLEIERRIIRRAILPTPREKPEPFPGQGSPSGLLSLTCSALWLVIDLGPAGVADGCRRPRDAGLSEARRPWQAPRAPSVLATACRAGRNPGLLLQCGSRRRACTWFAKGDKQPRSADRASAGERLQQGEVGLGLGRLGHGVVTVGHGLSGDAEWSHESLDEQHMGRHEACSRGQGGRSVESLAPLRAHRRRADVMVTQQRRKSGTMGEWHGREGGPAAQAVTEAPGLFSCTPAQDMREGVLEGPGQAGRETPRITNEAAAGRDALGQRAPLWALRLARLPLGALGAPELEVACGVRGIILGAAGGERLAVPCAGAGSDGAQDEDRVWAQRGNPGPLSELQAYGAGVTAAALAQGPAPGIDGFRGRVEATGLAYGGASGLETERLLGLGPVDADECSTWLVG